MSNTLKKDLLKLKASILQHLQSLRSYPNSELNLTSQLNLISNQIQELRDTANREEKIKALKHQITRKKQEYFKKCQLLLSSYTSLGSKLEEVEEELSLSLNCSNINSDKIPLRELILYSLRISGTSSAPSSWNRIDVLPMAFVPPFPQDQDIKATKLYEADHVERTAKPTITINKLNDHHQIIISSVPGSYIRYTLDGSLPSDMTGVFYTEPFILPQDSDCTVKAVAFMEWKRESEIAAISLQNASLAAPMRLEHVAERPAHIVTNRGQLDLGLFSPGASSRLSDDDEFTSPFLSFGR